MRFYFIFSIVLLFSSLVRTFAISYTVTNFNKLDSLSNAYLYSDKDKCIKYAIDMLHVAKGLENNEMIGKAYHSLGYIYSHFEDQGQAIYSYLKAIDYKKKYSDNVGIGECYSSIGTSFYKANDYKKSITYLGKSIELLKSYPDNIFLHDSYFYFSKIYRERKEFNKALEFLLLSRRLSENSRNLKYLAFENTHLGSVYRKLLLYDSAIYYDNLTLEIGKRLKDKVIMARAMNNLGYNYYCIKDYTTAIKYFNSSIDLKAIEELANCYLSLADTYIDMGKAKEAEMSLELALLNSPKLKDAANTTLSLVNFFKTRNNTKGTIKYLELLHKIEEEMFQQSKTDYQATYQSKYAESGEQKYINEVQKESIALEVQIQKERNIFILILSVVSLIISFALLQRYLAQMKLNNAQKKQIEIQQQDFILQEEKIREAKQLVSEATHRAREILFRE